MVRGLFAAVSGVVFAGFFLAGQAVPAPVYADGLVEHNIDRLILDEELVREGLAKPGSVEHSGIFLVQTVREYGTAMESGSKADITPTGSIGVVSEDKTGRERSSSESLSPPLIFFAGAMLGLTILSRRRRRRSV